MTTVDLLHEVLEHDAAAAATPDRVAAVRARLGEVPSLDQLDDPPLVVTAAVGPRGGRWRPGAVALGGLVATVVAALVVTLVVADRTGGGADDGPAAAASAAALPVRAYAFSVAPDPGGWSFGYAGTAAGVQGGFWFDGGPTAGAVLDVATAPGVDTVPTRPDDAETVDVAGTTGWRAPWDDTRAGLYFSIGRASTLTVWRDPTSGLWVALAVVGADTARIDALVATVRVGDYHPVRSPLALRGLPAGTHLDAVSEGQGHFQLVFGPHGSQFVVGVGPAGTEGGDGETGTAPPQPLVVGGWRGTYRADDPITKVSDGRVDVVVMDGPGQRQTPGGPTSAMPLDQLTALLAGLTVADLDDPAAWSDLATAVPGS